MFGNHGLCGLLEEGAHEKSPKCLDGNLGDFGGILQRSLSVYRAHCAACVQHYPSAAAALSAAFCSLRRAAADPIERLARRRVHTDCLAPTAPLKSAYF